MTYFTLLLTICVLLQACIDVDLGFIQGNPMRSILKTTVDDWSSNTKRLSDELNRIADLEAKNSELEKQNEDLLKEKKELVSNQEQLKKEITSLRGEMESMPQKLQVIMDAKLSLELEVAAYRKLL